MLAGESGQWWRTGEGERDADERSASSSDDGGVAATIGQAGGEDETNAVSFPAGSPTGETTR